MYKCSYVLNKLPFRLWSPVTNSSLKALTPAQLTLAQTHFPMMLPVCYSLKSIGLDTDTNTFSNVATSLLTSIFEKQFSF